jgi:hypothetical protein
MNLYVAFHHSCHTTSLHKAVNVFAYASLECKAYSVYNLISTGKVRLESSCEYQIALPGK